MSKKKDLATVGPTKCVLYTRVSTGKQAESGLGLEAQLTKCEEHSRRKGYEVVGRFKDEAVTGKETLDRGKRPELGAMLDTVSAHPGAVVVTYALSRLSRRQKLTWDLLDDRGPYRLTVESVTEPFDMTTPMGRAMIGMIAIWNTLEADMCSQRTSAALQVRKARGHRLGPRPLAEERPDVVRQVQALYAEGQHSHKTLADELNRLGVRPMRGERWHPTSVARTLRQEVKAAPTVVRHEGGGVDR